MKIAKGMTWTIIHWELHLILCELALHSWLGVNKIEIYESSPLIDLCLIYVNYNCIAIKTFPQHRNYYVLMSFIECNKQMNNEIILMGRPNVIYVPWIFMRTFACASDYRNARRHINLSHPRAPWLKHFNILYFYYPAWSAHMKLVILSSHTHSVAEIINGSIITHLTVQSNVIIVVIFQFIGRVMLTFY
jgi:hypothetical protein